MQWAVYGYVVNKWGWSKGEADDLSALTLVEAAMENFARDASLRGMPSGHVIHFISDLPGAWSHSGSNLSI